MSDAKFLHVKAVFRKMLFMTLVPVALASCTASAMRNNRSEPEIFRVGELEVRLYSDRDRMMSSLPPLLMLLAATRVGNDQIQVSGYYDKENKRIYAINDAKTVIHEFKHYLEPEWKHGADSQHADRSSNVAPVRSLPILSAEPSLRSGSRQPITEDPSEF